MLCCCRDFYGTSNYMRMKLPIKITTETPVATVNNVAHISKRKAQFINKLCDEDKLNYGFAFSGKRDKGIKLIILDERARAFFKKCKEIDRKG